MSYSAAEAVIKMADSLTAEVMMWAADFWEQARIEDGDYEDINYWEYEFERHFPDTNWNDRFLRWALEEMFFAQGSWVDDRRDVYENDEIPF